MTLYDGGSVVIQNAGKDAVSQITDRNRCCAFTDSFGALEADQSGADDQDAGGIGNGFFQRKCIIQCQEGIFFRHGIKSFKRRQERGRAGCQTQRGIWKNGSVIQQGFFFLFIDRNCFFAVEDLTAHALIKGLIAVTHPFQIRFLFQVIRDQRTTVDLVVFFGNHGDRPFFVHAADAFDASGGGNAVADDNILLHSTAPRSS